MLESSERKCAERRQINGRVSSGECGDERPLLSQSGIEIWDPELSSLARARAWNVSWGGDDDCYGPRRYDREGRLDGDGCADGGGGEGIQVYRDPLQCPNCRVAERETAGEHVAAAWSQRSGRDISKMPKHGRGLTCILPIVIDRLCIQEQEKVTESPT